jgi:glycosyltransferase involved in cell wall biosynthesis
MIRFAELVILPSLFENLSNAGLEAMALGWPVIGTYGTSFEEIIEDGINGFLVEPGDAGELGRKILSCLKRPDLEQIGVRAYQSALRFDSRTVALENVEFYRTTLAGL